MMNDGMNHVLRGNTLCSDGADHQHVRRIIQAATPTALNIARRTRLLESRAVGGRIDCQGYVLRHNRIGRVLPVDIVASAVGLPQEGRERMLVWATQMFNCFGPLNDRARSAFPVLQEMMHHARTQAVRGKLTPASWADAILDAMDRGDR